MIFKLIFLCIKMALYKVINESIFGRTDVKVSFLCLFELSMWMSKSYKKTWIASASLGFFGNQFHFILPSKVIVCLLAKDMGAMKMAAWCHAICYLLLSDNNAEITTWNRHTKKVTTRSCSCILLDLHISVLSNSWTPKCLIKNKHCLNRLNKWITP